MRRFARTCAIACLVGFVSAAAQAAPVDLPQLTTFYYQPTATGLPQWAKDLSQSVADVLKTFMSGLVPNPMGAEVPNPIERPVDQYVARLNSRLGVVLQGVGNLKVLGGPFYFNDLNGGAGIQIDLVPQPTDGSTPDTVLALRLSPLYGEIALIRLDAGGGYKPIPMPTQIFIGTSFGIEASKRIGNFEPGARVYARPLWQVVNTDNSGVAVFGALFCRIFVKDLKTHPGGKLYITPTFSYYDKGTGLSEIYDWRVIGLQRQPAALRKIWELTVGMEFVTNR